jgi:thiamine pyrophosphate-dependent acetolactate synthase large subunit-like protein
LFWRAGSARRRSHEENIDPAEFGRNYPGAIGAVPDLKEALKVLNRVARKLAPKGVQRPTLVAEGTVFTPGGFATLEHRAERPAASRAPTALRSNASTRLRTTRRCNTLPRETI